MQNLKLPSKSSFSKAQSLILIQVVYLFIGVFMKLKHLFLLCAIFLFKPTCKVFSVAPEETFITLRNDLVVALKQLKGRSTLERDKAIRDAREIRSDASAYFTQMINTSRYIPPQQKIEILKLLGTLSTTTVNNFLAFMQLSILQTNANKNISRNDKEIAALSAINRFKQDASYTNDGRQLSDKTREEITSLSTFLEINIPPEIAPPHFLKRLIPRPTRQQITNLFVTAVFFSFVLADALAKRPELLKKIKSPFGGRKNGEKTEEEVESLNDLVGFEKPTEKVRSFIVTTKHPKRFKKIKKGIQKGILLYGLPGTGKTAFARAVAKEIGGKSSYLSRLSYLSAPELIIKWAGEGPRKVRDIFARAKKKIPHVIFIDEIDAIAKPREIEGPTTTILNQLLTEMSGFEKLQGVLVIAATNNIGQIDKALLSRFDQFEILFPTEEGRKKILMRQILEINKEIIADDIDKKFIETLVKQTSGFTGRFLREKFVDEAIDILQIRMIKDPKIVAGEKNGGFLTKKDFIQALETAKQASKLEKKHQYQPRLQQFFQQSATPTS